VEFVNILEDGIAQDFFSATPDVEIEHQQKADFFQQLADASRARFRADFPKRG
jgi:hypothetical protein